MALEGGSGPARAGIDGPALADMRPRPPQEPEQIGINGFGYFKCVGQDRELSQVKLATRHVAFVVRRLGRAESRAGHPANAGRLVEGGRIPVRLGVMHLYEEKSENSIAEAVSQAS